MIKKLNNYFFDEDEITLSDSIWFYGVALAVPVITFITVLLAS